MAFSSHVDENLAPDVLRRISKEIKDLFREPIEGVKIVANEQNITELMFSIDGPTGTPYAGGQFRVKLSFPHDYPASPPRGYFLTRIFHPNVAPSTGEICVNTLKKDWRPNLGVKNVILTIKCLLIVPNAESALNEEAGKLLLDHYDDYSRRAKMMTEIHARPQDPDSDKVNSNCKRPSESVGSDEVLTKAKDKSKKMLKRL